MREREWLEFLYLVCYLLDGLANHPESQNEKNTPDLRKSLQTKPQRTPVPQHRLS